jgi:hypothetical protein
VRTATRAALLALTVVAAPGMASAGTLSIGDGWSYGNGVIFHQPHVMRPPHRGSECCGLLVYRTGPVLYRPHAYLILWGYGAAGDPDGVASLLERFLGNVGGTAWLNTVTQYHGLRMRDPKNHGGMLKGVWQDDVDPIPSSPTDADVAAEAVRGAATFGLDPDGSYVVATAHGHNTAGFGSSFCGYHSTVLASSGRVSYTNLPYMPDAPICGSNKIAPPPDETAADEGVTIVEGHEFAESITDPFPVTGWWNETYGELGDECAWTDLQNTPIGRFTYTTQPLFSNASDSCVQRYP